MRSRTSVAQGRREWTSMDINGRWRATAIRTEIDDWGVRNVALIAWHVNAYRHADSGWDLLPGEVGVDSGTAGIWDVTEYIDPAERSPEYERYWDMIDREFAGPFAATSVVTLSIVLPS